MEFWVPIVVTNGYNKNMVNMEQIKKELYDYYCVMQEVSKVYYHVTNGKFSKPIPKRNLSLTNMNLNL